MSPSQDIILKDVIALKPENTIKEAMDVFKQYNIRSIPVIDDNKKFHGVFGLRHILTKLLPASVQMEDGLENLDFVKGATPDIVKRLSKLYAEPIKEHLDEDAVCVDPDTSMWEITRVMATKGSPVAIVEEKTQQFVGLVSRQTLLEHLDSQIKEIIE